MTTRYGPVLFGALAVLGALAWCGAARASSPEGPSLEAARALYAERLLESAGLELREIVASDADAETRAAALHLLGRIAVEHGRYGEALTLWSDLAEGFAGTAAATEAATEKHLVEALVECRGQAPAGVLAEAGAGATRAVPRVSEPPATPDSRAPAPAAAGSTPGSAPGPPPAAGSSAAISGEAAGSSEQEPTAPAAPGDPATSPAPAFATVPSAPTATPASAPAAAPAASPPAAGASDPGASSPAAESPPMPSGAAPAASAPAPPTAPTPSASTGAASAAPAPTADVPAATDEAPPAPESASAAPPAAAPGRAAAALAPAPTTGLVLVAGRGKPYDAVRQAIGEFTGFLVERGVAAESPTEGIALVEESASALERLLEAARERGAESLLHVEAQFGHRERIEIECYRPDGELLWREKVTGGMGFSERTMNEKLVRRLEEKLAERVGGPGLPAGGSAGR